MKCVRDALALSAFLLLFGTNAILAQALPPDYSVNLLDSFSFNDTTNWTDDDYDVPLSWTNLTAVHGDGPAVLMDSTNACWFEFPLIVDGPWTNLSLAQGTVQFWCFPTNSVSTNGWCLDPGQTGTFIEVGSSNGPAGWWALYTDGSNILFTSQDSTGVLSNYFATPINWSSGTNGWQFLALTYNSNSTQLYLNSSLVVSGPGMGPLPDPSVLSGGMFIGSSGASNQLHAAFDDFWTYDAPVDPSTIVGNYAVYGIVYGNLPPPSPLIQPTLTNAPSSPGYVPVYDAITGLLNGVATNTGCLTSSGVWITNLVCTPTTNGMMVNFSIAGGSNGVPYDIFANTVLDFSSNTNLAWAWLGQGYQCVTYSLTVQSSAAAFLILGTPQDSDHDGLTDAYERLVSKTNPYSPDTSGDGMADSDKVLAHLNPLAQNPAFPAVLSVACCPQ
jgi:hypothetical protein